MKQASQAERKRVSLLEEVIENEPLLETDPSLKGINPALDTCESGSIYFGTGLCTPTKLSVGLPFDVLSMSLCAEKIRRALDFETIYHHIADTHALSNQLFNEHSVRNLAKDTRETLRLMTRNLGLVHYEVMLASEFDTTPRYDTILGSIRTEEHEYVRRELADVEWYREEKGVRLKVGWIIQAKETSLKFDERLFDREYLRVVNNEMSFVYAKAGRTFDKSRPKASPYISLEDENRIVLRPDEVVGEKLQGTQPSKKTIAHLRNIIRLYEEVVGPVGGEALDEKIQNIIDAIFS